WAVLEQVLDFRRQHGFTALVGDDRFFVRGRRNGADGVISGVACAAPELILGIDESIRCGRSDQTERLSVRLDEFLRWIGEFPTPVIVRESVALRGLKTGGMAVPLGAERLRRLDEFREWFPGWLREVQQEVKS